MDLTAIEIFYKIMEPLSRIKKKTSYTILSTWISKTPLSSKYKRKTFQHTSLTVTIRFKEKFLFLKTKINLKIQITETKMLQFQFCNRYKCFIEKIVDLYFCPKPLFLIEKKRLLFLYFFFQQKLHPICRASKIKTAKKLKVF